MNLEKSKKRIVKKVKMGFQGYPEISISYFGSTKDIAEEVAVSFVPEEGLSLWKSALKVGLTLEKTR